MKQWVISGDVLELIDGRHTLAATADQVYSSVVEHIPMWNDLEVGKSGAAQGLKFSPYTVDVRAVLSNNLNDGFPKLTFEATTQRGITFPVSSEAVRREHVVYCGIWHPITTGIRQDIECILNTAGMTLCSVRPQNLRAYLTLKKSAADGHPIIDRVSENFLKVLSRSVSRNEQPIGIVAELYPYQVIGWRWLQFLVQENLGGVLADEMGLGKTLQVISALRDPGQGVGISEALVVAPGSLLENWVREIRRFCPDFSTLKHHGPFRTGRPTDLRHIDVVITSYDTAVRDLSLLKMIDWTVVVLDEAQYIRNPEAMRTRAVKQIRRKSALAVTGTPIENRLRDLWSIMDFVVPGYLSDIVSFESSYDESVEAASVLESLVTPLVLRRRIEELSLDLPDRIDIPEILELSEDEAKLYELLRNSIFATYGANANLVSITKLRQFCAHPDIVNARSKSNMSLPFSKLKRLQDLLDEIFSTGEKAIVFTSYTAMADRIAHIAQQDSAVFAATFDGRTNIGDRQPLIDQFTAHLGPAVMVLNPRAGGTGLNITAANHVIHYNPEWNPALEDQASARVFRLGQDRPVTVRRMIFANTVEEVIDERLRRKRLIAGVAVVGVEGRDEDYLDIVAALERSPYSGLPHNQ